MVFEKAIPMLPSTDIERSLVYYVDRLRFERRWHWGDPVCFGGVVGHSVELHFSKADAGLPMAPTSVMIIIDDVDAYFRLIKEDAAVIASEPADTNYSMREMCVTDPDGNLLRFAHLVNTDGRAQRSGDMPDGVRIVERAPTMEELEELLLSVGWKSAASETNITDLSIYDHIAIAESDAGGVIGCAFLFSDRNGYCVVKNVIVHPEWQSKRIGTALIRNLLGWLRANRPRGTYIALITNPALAPFYRQFGFTPVFGMHLSI